MTILISVSSSLTPKLSLYTISLKHCPSRDCTLSFFLIMYSMKSDCFFTTLLLHFFALTKISANNGKHHFAMQHRILL